MILLWETGNVGFEGLTGHRLLFNLLAKSGWSSIICTLLSKSFWYLRQRFLWKHRATCLGGHDLSFFKSPFLLAKSSKLKVNLNFSQCIFEINVAKLCYPKWIVNVPDDLPCNKVRQILRQIHLLAQAASSKPHIENIPAPRIKSSQSNAKLFWILLHIF